MAKPARPIPCSSAAGWQSARAAPTTSTILAFSNWLYLSMRSRSSGFGSAMSVRVCSSTGAECVWLETTATVPRLPHLVAPYRFHGLHHLADDGENIQNE